MASELTAETTVDGPALASLDAESLKRLHRGQIGSSEAVRAMLTRLRQQGVVLFNGVDRRSVPRRARVSWISDTSLGLKTRGISRQPSQLFFSFDMDERRYFFAAHAVSSLGRDGALVVELPPAIYEAERRDLSRVGPQDNPRVPTRVRMRWPGQSIVASVVDWSYQGLGVRFPEPKRPIANSISVDMIDGARAGHTWFAKVCHRNTTLSPSGSRWVRLGLRLSKVREQTPIAVEYRATPDLDSRPRSTWRRLGLARSIAAQAPRLLARRLGLVVSSNSSPVEVVEYPNQRGERVRALVDRACGGHGGTAILIPPAWGRTKETLSPLAAILSASFEKAGEPAVVLRFDGTHRRGESFIRPEFRHPGREYLNFTFSQAVQDILSSVDYIESTFAPKRLLLLTFSLAAIEGRRAIAADPGQRFDAWISVVGMVDLQSGLRAVSGGVDYAFGLLNGVDFGNHELVGVVANMDHTGRDALEHNLVFLEDARCDMAQIRIPITWLHGRYDGWMELERVRTLLSAGSAVNRRLVELPIGHQMRNSREALRTFEMIAGESLRLTLDREMTAAIPDLAGIESKTRAERARLKQGPVETRPFWRDYVVGRDRTIGIELMTATSAYKEFMSIQIDRLSLAENMVVADLGSGAGDFALALARQESRPSRITITATDYIVEGLRRGETRLEEVIDGRQWRCASIAADLGETSGLPFPNDSFDAVLASLILSYLPDPRAFLAEVRRVLRPGGRMVVSSLRRDADLSRIYVEGLAELSPDQVKKLFGSRVQAEFADHQRRFLNDAARLFDLEEAGTFRFWDLGELTALVAEAGFRVQQVDFAFGLPPQAVIISADS